MGNSYQLLAINVPREYNRLKAYDSLFSVWTLAQHRLGNARLCPPLIPVKFRRVDAHPHVVVGGRWQRFSQLKVVSLRPTEFVFEREDLKTEALRLAEVLNVAVTPVPRV